jgi:transposase
VLFLDAAHLIHGVNPSVVWSEKRLFVKANSGRKRLNVLGALDAVSHEMFYEANDTVVNAWTLVDLLRKIRAAYHEEPISIFLDNARYQKCYVVQIAANMMKIELVYLPAYSPNLNLIERIWKFVRKKCLNSKYYPAFSEHCNAIKSCIDNFTMKFQDELKSLLEWNFQTFNNQPFMPT